MRWRWSVPVLTLLLVLVGGVAAGSAGADSDDDAQIQARMASFVDHLLKGDAAGATADVAPLARAGCDETMIKEAGSLLSALNYKLKGTTATSVNGNNATADVTSSIGDGADLIEATAPQKFVKVDGTWYIDPDGKPCTDILG
jgi:hypothetical protein